MKNCKVQGVEIDVAVVNELHPSVTAVCGVLNNEQLAEYRNELLKNDAKVYEGIRAKFKEGDWVFGIGDHEGCSPTFDMDTDNPQPFSYLGDYNPDNYRLATQEEIDNSNWHG